MDKTETIIQSGQEVVADAVNGNSTTFLEQAFVDFLWTYTHGWVIVWLGVEVAIFGLIILAYKKWRDSSFVVFFDMFFEKVYEFFEDILGIEEKKWTKMYITTMFFIILLSNLMGVALELLLPIFGEEAMHHVISIPTADINFNVAMAIVGVIIVIYEQFKALGFWKAMYEYFPILGKNYIPYERGNMPAYIDWPVFLLVKTFDIIISVFLGMLEIVGHLAKVISLSFRLFWNVTSGGILLGMLFWAVIGATTFMSGITWVEGDGLPILAPIILYLQELLVAFIQALVFPLLIAIFIKVAKVH